MSRTAFAVLGGGQGGKLMAGLEIKIIGFFLKIGDWRFGRGKATLLVAARVSRGKGFEVRFWL